MAADNPDRPADPAAPDRAGRAGGITFAGATQISGPVIAGNVQNLFVGESQDQQQRQRLAALVEDYWVRPVLDALAGPRTVGETALRPAPVWLGKRVQRAALLPPARQVVPRPADRPGELVPPGTPILDIFDRLGSLLILGAPGAGKTVTLYELAQALLARARADPGRPIPVVLNLASWARSRPPLATWLVDELAAQYRIPRELGAGWLQQGALLPLLDGLDEMPPPAQAACVPALNAFPAGLTGLVVCCRIASYNALPTLLELGGQVTLEPLGGEQIDAYLEAGGPGLAPLRAAVQADPALRELARTPLMLQVLSTVYAQLPAAVTDGDPGAPLAARGEHVLAAAVTLLLERVGRSPDAAYPVAQARPWLAWLARHLAREQRGTFLIEQLQPTWLESRAEQWLYFVGSRTVTWLILGLGLFWWAPLGSGGLSALWSVILVPGLVSGFVTGALARRAGAAPGHAPPVGWWRRATGGGGLARAAGTFLAVLLTTLPMLLLQHTALVDAISISGGVAVLYGFLATVVFGQARDGGDGDIQPLEAVRWSWAGAWRGLRRAILVCVIPLLVLFVLVLLWTGVSMENIVTDLVVVLLLIAPPFVPPILLGGLLLGGLRGRAIATWVRPNQGIRESAKNAALLALVFGGGAAVVAFLVTGLYVLRLGIPDFGWGSPPPTAADKWNYVFGTAGPVGLALALIGGLTRGGFAVIQHYTLRAILTWRGRMPWRYVPFLDHVAESQLLRKAGPGYQFVHDLILRELAQPGGAAGEGQPAVVPSEPAPASSPE